MQHFSVRERLGVAAAAGIVLLLGLGGWAYGRAGGDATPKPAFAPVGANGAPAAIEIAAGGDAPPTSAGKGNAVAAPAAPAVLVVHVTGEERNPGVYKFKNGDRIADAIHAAGGFKDHADQEALNLADTLRDADQICVPLLVKLSGSADTAESRPFESSAPAAPRHRAHPLIVHGASPTELAPAPVIVDNTPTTATAPEAAQPVAPIVMQRAPGRVLGRPAPVEAVAVDAAAADDTATSDPNSVAVDAPIPSDINFTRVSAGKKGRVASTRLSKGGKSAGKSAKFKNPGDGVVHLNSATAAQFEQLPGVGPAMSGRIVEYRAQIGKFTDVSQLMDVKGIGEKKYAKMQPFLAL